MATTVNISYQAIATAIAITSADSLANGNYCSSALVDNQTTKYVDAIFGGSIQTGTLTGEGNIEIYVVGSWDGTDFTAGVDAGDAAITWGTTGNTHVDGHKDLILVGFAATDSTDDDTDVRFGPFSVASAFGGVMPLEWAVVFRNQTGGTFHATGTNNHLEYTGIEYDSA